LTYIRTGCLESYVTLTDEETDIVATTNYKAHGDPTQNEKRPEAPGYTGTTKTH
jgi:hypothetical protein